MKIKVIKILKDSKNYISGEELSRRLNITRAAIWKNIEELRKDGYKITATKSLGYKLIFVPDKFFAVEVQSGLRTKTLGQKIYHYEEVESTMKEAFRFGLDGEPEGSVFIAEGQKKGKGRLGRTWSSPKGKGIYMSLILRPKFSLIDIPKITLLTGVAVCEAICRYTKIDAKLKWPNDILINGKKVSGILTELNAETDRVKFVVVGIGININTSVSILPEHSISLKGVLGEKVRRLTFLQEVLRSLELWYEKVSKEGFDVMLRRWKELSCTLGRRVCIEGVEGEAVDVDDYGALMIRNDRGEIVKRMSGDCILV